MLPPPAVCCSVTVARAAWRPSHKRLHYNLILTENESHIFCALITVCLSILHIALRAPRSSSLMSSDFNESDRCKQYGGNLSFPLVHRSQLWRENRLSAAAGFWSKIAFSKWFRRDLVGGHFGSLYLKIWSLAAMHICLQVVQLQQSKHSAIFTCGCRCSSHFFLLSDASWFILYIYTIFMSSALRRGYELCLCKCLCSFLTCPGPHPKQCFPPHHHLCKENE